MTSAYLRLRRREIWVKTLFWMATHKVISAQSPRSEEVDA
jgi:hypothetical protein